MADDETRLRLNSLARYKKRSPSLVLEEYSHCEVPAGCGGVVLRWRDKKPQRQYTLQVTAEAQTIEAWIDGVPLSDGSLVRRTAAPGDTIAGSLGPRHSSGSFGAEPGERVIAFKLLGLGPGPGPVRFAAMAVPIVPIGGRIPAGLERLPWLLTRADGSWRATDVEPGPDWAGPRFYDGEWPVLTEAPARDGELPWRVATLIDAGGAELAWPGRADPLWIRGRWTVLDV